MPNLVLASASPRRRDLLALLGLPFSVVQSSVAETPQPEETPADLVIRLSQAKAVGASTELMRTGAAGTKEAILIACDTVVALGNEVLGKPTDVSEAARMLQRLRARPHAVFSAVAVLDTSAQHALTALASTEVLMRDYTDAELAAYIATGDPLDKAGAYAIQNTEFHPVAEFHGCYANVVGLPLCHLTRCLRTLGMSPLFDTPTACQAFTGQCCEVYTAILAGQSEGSSL